MRRPIALIGSAIGWGSSRRAARDGPHKLLAGGLAETLAARGLDAAWRTVVVEAPSSAGRLGADPTEATSHVAAHVKRLADEVAGAVAEGRFALTIGGDNSGAIGHYLGLRRGLAPGRGYGLVWIDAHPDSNTLATTPSYGAHGMVVSTLLGDGPPQIAMPAAPGLAPANVAYLGARDIDPGEAAYIAERDMMLITAAQCRARGVRASFEACVRVAAAGVAGFGVSIDLDGIDPDDAPGVAFPVADGLPAADLLEALTALRGDDRLLGLEISEFEPSLDRDGKTAALVAELIVAALGDD